MAEIRLMATSGILGYGFTEAAFRRGLSLGVDVIACDGGSMDPGPYYLGAGEPFVSRAAAKRDLMLMLKAGVTRGVPVIVGSAGGGGSDRQLDWLRDIALEIASEKGLSFRMALIRAEPGREYLKRMNAEGRIRPLGPIEDLTDGVIDESARIVAMMGPEPLQAALADGAEVVLAGRASDAALFAAVPLMRGFDPGLSWHLGKIIECAAQVVEPREGQDCVIGTLRDDHFLVEPGHPDKRCPRIRVAGHTLYENPSPYRLAEPGGTLDTTGAAFEQADARTVKVSGSIFETADAYTVKLEGARREGFRTVFIAGTRDPTLVAGIDGFVDACRDRVANAARSLGIAPDQYRLTVRLYGKSGTMGPAEPVEATAAHELGIVVDVVAEDAETSAAVTARARYCLMHTDFPGRMCISGNLAIPFSPSDIPAGETYGFSVWHTLRLDDPMEPFAIEWVTV